MKQVTIYSDGACRGNPGPGGWAAILRYNGAERQISGGVPATTNNRMELQAAIQALKTLKEPCKVWFYTDSVYLQNGVTKWIQQWITRNWQTKGSTHVRNRELWQELHRLSQQHVVTWHWIKGHSKSPENVRCDRLARLEIANINRSFGDRQLKQKLTEFLCENGIRRLQSPILR